MKISAIAFTDAGEQLGRGIGLEVERGVPVMQWAKERFDSSDALVFIGACGIAVRAIAPLCKSKTTDPAVIAMDDGGRFVIPLMSGHIGGANELAIKLSKLTGAVPVITTATDVRGITAADTWAVKNNCAIENPVAIKNVSSALLAGSQVGVMITERELVSPYPITLKLRPRTLNIGIGCKRGTDEKHIEACVTQFLAQSGLSMLSVRAVASIDIKKDEQGIKDFCEKYAFPFETYSADELNAVQGVFAHSDFVFKTTGTGCVCERAAVRAGGRLLVGKTVYEGVTLALSGDKDL